LIGGKRLDPPSHIFNNVWMLDLTTLVWSLIFSPDTVNATAETEFPEPRYFHTATNYKNEAIIVFGGLSPGGEGSAGERCLDDIAFFDLTKREWRIPKFAEGTQLPPKRYAHVAAISRDRLVIAGGELRFNGTKSSPENLLDLHVFDIPTEKWVHNRTFGTAEDHIGYYRSIMATAPYTPVSYPINNREEEDRLLDNAETLYQQIPAAKLNSEPSSPTSYRSRSGSLENSSPIVERRPSRGNLNAIPETESSDSEPFIYVYSTRQRSTRDISRLLMKIHSPTNDNFVIDDLSSQLPQRGGIIPLKFPYGDIIGDWLLYCGTIPNQKPVDVPGRPRPTTPPPLKPAAFHILALHLPTQQFKVIDAGNVFLTGSWNRGVIWPEQNSFVVFGNVNSDMNADYAMRRSNFSHIVMVDLEVFGVYVPPKVTTGTFAKDMALNLLSRKEFSDMDIFTKDNFRIHVNSRILAHRWPMLSEVLNTCIYGSPYAGEQARRPSVASAFIPRNQHPTLPISERPRVLYLPLTNEHATAFLSYLYTDSLPPDADVDTLCALLVLSKTYSPGLERLAALISDSLHQKLTEGNAWQIIEAAALSGRTGLQVQAMLMMRTAADLKSQALRRRQQLRSKDSIPTLPNGNGTENGVAPVVGQTNGTSMAIGASDTSDGSGMKSSESAQSGEGTT
jgi:Galactose oxidase, central domain